MTLDELRRIAAAVAPQRRWDFSRMRDNRDPVPWEYGELVRRSRQIRKWWRRGSIG